MDMEKLMPGILIGGGALAAIYFLSKGNRSPVVSNALIPTATPVQTPSTDPLRLAAFQTLGNVALGSQRLQEQSQSIGAQLDLGRFRLQEQQALANASLQATQAGQQTSLELARIAQQGALNRLQAQLGDRNFDRELQQRALDQTFALAQQGQINQGIGQLLSGVLAALGRPAQARGGTTTGGAATGAPSRPAFRFPSIPRPNIGPYTPPFNPGYYSGNVPDPFQSGYYGQAPPGGMLDVLPYDYFGNIPLNPPNYDPYPAPPLPSSDFPEVGGGFEEVPFSVPDVSGTLLGGGGSIFDNGFDSGFGY